MTMTRRKCYPFILGANEPMNLPKFALGSGCEWDAGEILLLSSPSLDGQLCRLGLIVAYRLPC